MTVLEKDSPELFIFIPAELAATCADCGGIFLAQAGKCSGCGSREYVIHATGPNHQSDEAERFADHSLAGMHDARLK